MVLESALFVSRGTSPEGRPTFGREDVVEPKPAAYVATVSISQGFEGYDESGGILEREARAGTP